MRVACVLVTHLRARVEIKRQPHLAKTPAVIVDRSGSRTLVVDSLPAARGVLAGMTLEQALSRHAETVVIDADEPAYRRAFRGMLTSLQAVGDRVEESDLGTAYVRLDGLQNSTAGRPASSAPSSTPCPHTWHRASASQTPSSPPSSPRGPPSPSGPAGFPPTPGPSSPLTL